MANTPTVNKIKLPSGYDYYLEDTEARDAIAALEGQSYFLGKSLTALTDGATTNPINVDGKGSVTATNGNVVAYGNAEFVWDGAKWIEFGDLSTLGSLAYKSSVSLNKGNGANALGENATFTTTVTPTTTNIKATASGAAVGADGTANAITGFGAHTTDTALGTGATFSTSVIPTTAIIKATASGAAVGANGTDTFVKSYPGATSKMVTTPIPNVTSAGSASTWGFAMGTGTEAKTLIISGANGSAPTLGTAITAATGALNANGTGASVMTGLGTATTASALTGVQMTAQPAIAISRVIEPDPYDSGTFVVATGITSASTSVNQSDTVTAITALGTPTTAAALTGVKMTAQPTVALATGATAGTGVISVATGITSATTTANSKDAKKVALYDDLSVSVS